MDAFLKVIASGFKEGLVTHEDAYNFLKSEFVSTIQNNPSKKATMLAVMGKDAKLEKFSLDLMLTWYIFLFQVTVP